MTTLVLMVDLLSTMATAADDSRPSLGGGFIQFDNMNSGWTPRAWSGLLERMRRARLNVVILQYLETQDGESYVPQAQGEEDPVGAILDCADNTGMTVFLDLRLDRRLQTSAGFNHPGELRAKLARGIYTITVTLTPPSGYPSPMMTLSLIR